LRRCDPLSNTCVQASETTNTRTGSTATED
jgi:hypothetical protein